MASAGTVFLSFVVRPLFAMTRRPLPVTLFAQAVATWIVRFRWFLEASSIIDVVLMAPWKAVRTSSKAYSPSRRLAATAATWKAGHAKNNESQRQRNQQPGQKSPSSICHSCSLRIFRYRVHRLDRRDIANLGHMTVKCFHAKLDTKPTRTPVCLACRATILHPTDNGCRENRTASRPRLRFPPLPLEKGSWVSPKQCCSNSLSRRQAMLSARTRDFAR